MMYTVLDHVSCIFGSVNPTYGVTVNREWHIFQVRNTDELRRFPIMYRTTHFYISQ
jgi:hypothetical protein